MPPPTLISAPVMPAVPTSRAIDFVILLIVDPAERGHGLLDEGLDIVLHGHVAGEERGAVTDTEVGQSFIALLV